MILVVLALLIVILVVIDVVCCSTYARVRARLRQLRGSRRHLVPALTSDCPDAEGAMKPVEELSSTGTILVSVEI